MQGWLDMDLELLSRLSTVAIALVTILGVPGGLVIWALKSKTVADSAHATAKDAKLIALAAEAKAQLVHNDLSDFKTVAAREYVSNEAVGRLEGRIEELGREFRSGIGSVQKQLVEIFARPASRN